jgi:hypothetical protein
MLRRAQDAWENGAVWVSVLFGLGYFAPPPVILLTVLVIADSGAPFSTQISAAIVFVIGTLASLEIALVSYVIAPNRTEAVLRPAHRWALAHRRTVLITLFAFVGIWALATGVGII